MKISKKIIFIFIILLILFGIFTKKTYADSGDLSLENVNYNIEINTDGSMDVEEIWNIDIEETNTLFKEFKIDRTKYSDIVNGSVSTVIDGVEVPLEDYMEYAYHLPTNEYYFLNLGSSYEVAWGTGLENSSAKRTYIIRYTVVDAIAKYNDVAEMYWQLFGNDFEIPIKKLTGTITLPENAQNLDDIKVWGHSEALNGTINVTDTNTVEFEVNRNNANNMVEVRVAMPTEMINYSGRQYNIDKLSSIIEEETEWANEANAKRTTHLIIVGIVFGTITLFLVYILIKNIKVMKDTIKLYPTQQFDYFRELPRKDATPLEAKYIIDNCYSNINPSVLGQIFMATILNLNIKKAIKIESVISDSGKEKDSKIIINTNNIAEITSNKDEINVFNILKSAVNKCGNSATQEITLKELKKYIRANDSLVRRLVTSFDMVVKKSLLDKKILSAEGIKKKQSLKHNSILFALLPISFYIFIAFSGTIINFVMSNNIYQIGALLILALLIIDITLGVKAVNKIDAYTQEGIDEQEKWKAFKKYMEDFSLLNEKDVPDIALWEYYLVFATAFGISEKVIKQLKIVYPEYMDDSNFLANYVTMRMLMNTDFTKSFGSVGSTMTSTFSSGSGGGGGFSGGGGGGRWRSEAAVVAK